MKQPELVYQYFPRLAERRNQLAGTMSGGEQQQLAIGRALVGNPALKPERSRSVETGLQWNWGQGDHLRLGWFDNRFTDLIDFDPVLFKTVNRAHVRAHGIEAEADWRATPTVRLSGALAYLSLDSATPLRDRPRWQGNVRAGWLVSPELELGGAVRFNGSFYEGRKGMDRVQDYAALVVAAYDGAKAADPTAQVGMSVASSDIGFLDLAIKAGAANHFDFICIHPYENIDAVKYGDEMGYLGLASTLRAMLAANADATARWDDLIAAGKKGPE